MYQEDMLDYFQSKMKKVKKNYSSALKKNDPDGVHDLRVDLKRLKAYYNLIESINRNFKSKNEFKIFKIIADNTGCLRDTQVQKDLIKKMNESLMPDIHEYLQFLVTIEKHHYELFCKFSQSKPLEKLKDSTNSITHALKNISPVRAETRAQGRFFNLRNNLILLSSNRRLSENILHKVRKQTKETHYTLEIINHSFHIFPDWKEFTDEISKVHKLLGDWHDLDVGLITLRNFIKDNKGSLPDEPYAILAKHIQDSKKDLRTHFRKTFNEFIRAASHYEL
ncbi:MAG: CHAD domain-containing protein [Candidatus Latescibacteria bacterium]|nr:CHAD domain-containing protein [Candidatus Latescibacterota bacterium]